MSPTPAASEAPLPHTPVMVAEVLEYLQVRRGGHYIDCTVGAGGHSDAILSAAADTHVLGLDADPEAIAEAGRQLARFGDRVTLVESYFDRVDEVVRTANFPPADGLIFDTGVSSMQLDRAERGFSFRRAGPLDMRFGPSAELTAADIVNHYSEGDLAQILRTYGEEWRARRIARRIVEHRPLHSTLELAKTVEQAAGKGRSASTRSRVHPATKTFLALRIAVNQELRHLSHLLALARGLLDGFGSRLVVVTFHSLEDRPVKQFLRAASSGPAPTFRLLTRKVVRPSAEEVERNPRSRSGRLRAAEAI